MVVELKDGSFCICNNEEELIENVVRVTCGDTVADELTEYIDNIRREYYTYEEYQDLEAEKDELKEENKRLESIIEIYKEGKNPFENELNEIQRRLLWISQDVADLKRISKAKKVEDARINILQSIKNLQNVIIEMKQ